MIFSSGGKMNQDKGSIYFGIEFNDGKQMSIFIYYSKNKIVVSVDAPGMLLKSYKMNRIELDIPTLKALISDLERILIFDGHEGIKHLQIEDSEVFLFFHLGIEPNPGDYLIQSILLTIEKLVEDKVTHAYEFAKILPLEMTRLPISPV